MPIIPIFIALCILWLVLDAYAKSTGKKISQVRRIDPATGKESIEIHETVTTGGMKSVAREIARFLKSFIVLMLLLVLVAGAFMAIVIFLGNK